MHLVFGIKNQFFAKLFFLFLSGHKSLNTRINFQMFLQKLMPFWVKAPSDIVFSPNSAMLESLKQNERKQKIVELN